MSGLTEDERDELFYGSVPFLAKRLLMVLAARVRLEPLEVLRRIAEGDLQE